MNSGADDVLVACPISQSDRGGSIPTSALFRKGEWWVKDLGHESGRAMVRSLHYSHGSSNTRVYCHGLFPRTAFWEQQRVGVALWIPPTKSAAQSFSENWQGVLSLSRLVIDNAIPKNAESFLIRHSMRLIDRERWPTLITYADTWQGHDGTIYKAAGWTECGMTKPERTYQINGRMVSRKAGPKTRTHSEMLAIGAVCVGKFSRIRFKHELST